MIILLHSSKTMKPKPVAGLRAPALLPQACELDAYLKTLLPADIAKAMHVSPALADKTRGLITAWSPDAGRQSPALDTFVGDIYSGLQAAAFNEADRLYADAHLRILSGLYGVLRPLDGIMPYRLEMGYRLPDPRYRSVYDFWGERVAATLPDTGLIVNTSSVEYSQVVTKYVDPARVVTPQFLTRDPKTGEPGFVVVHAKIARGAFARWLIQARVERAEQLPAFELIGYRYDARRSTPGQPVFICDSFEGKGLSMRLS